MIRVIVLFRSDPEDNPNQGNKNKIPTFRVSRSRSGYHGRRDSVLQGLVSRALVSLYNLSGQFPEIDGTKYGLAYCQEKRLLFEADMCALYSHKKASRPTSAEFIL